MKGILVLALGLIITAAVAAGTVACANEATTNSGSPKEVPVDTSYSGKTVEVSVDDSVIITLDSNPTTGFSWALKEISDGSVLQEAGHEYNAPQPTEPPLLGAGGKEVWTFKALKKGTSNISMEYRRPWEQGVQPAETFSLTVVVK